jgi:hypothetical protein
VGARAITLTVAAGLLAGCNGLKPVGPEFAPYLGTGAIVSAKPRAGRLVLTLEVNTVFASRDDDKAASRHVFRELRVALLGTSVPARLHRSSSDLRSNGADGSYQQESVWTDTWRATLAVPPASARGIYLVVLTGCREGGSDCSRTVVPVCVKHGRITGEPREAAGDEYSTDAAGFGRDPQWLRYKNCNHPIFGGGLGAQYESSTAHPDPRTLPADLAARVN